MFERVSSYLSYLGNRRTVRRVLAENRFESTYVGPINDIDRIDKFIISIPKCGTTSLQRGFESTGHRVLHAHNDPSTYNAFVNGEVLRNAGIGVETLARFRRHLNRAPIHFFFGYREPISWYLSLAGHYQLPSNDDLRKQIVENLRSAIPWMKYDITIPQKIVESATGISLFERPFDGRKGYSIRRKGNVTVVVYRYDKMPSLERYIRKRVERRFKLGAHMVNGNQDYLDFVRAFRLPADTISQVYSQGMFSYFYSEEEAAQLVARYVQG